MLDDTVPSDECYLLLTECHSVTANCTIDNVLLIMY